MKILYLLNWNIEHESGVVSKVTDQVKAWEAAGHEVYLWFVSYNTIEAFVPKSPKHVRVFDYKLNPLLLVSPIQQMVAKGKVFGKIMQELKQLCPDVIYFRQSSWFPNLDRILADYPSVMELNSDDLSEIARQPLVRRHIYLWGRPKLAKAVTAFLALSFEIGELYKQFDKPTKVIGNGINLSRIPAMEKVRSSRPQVVFVGSPDMDWHGTDKFLLMARLLPEFDFHLVGPVPTETPGSNVRVHGYLSKSDLQELYRKMNIGVGSLAIHRNNVSEASPLKVREYIAFGLPTIVAFKDTDLFEEKEYILTLPNVENNIEPYIIEIKNFVTVNSGNQVPMNVRMKVDITSKETQRLTFLRETIETFVSK